MAVSLRLRREFKIMTRAVSISYAEYTFGFRKLMEEREDVNVSSLTLWLYYGFIVAVIAASPWKELKLGPGCVTGAASKINAHLRKILDDTNLIQSSSNLEALR